MLLRLALTSIEIGVWFIGSQEESLSWLQPNKVEEEDTEASYVPGKLVIQSQQERSFLVWHTYSILHKWNLLR